MSGSPAADGKGGFTLLEVLVALIIGGILTGVLFELISGQGRFVQIQSAREEVQQNSRAALELIGSELRTLPGGGALVRAAADSITIRAPRVWGTVCAVTNATSVDIAVPAIAGVSYTTNIGTGLAVNLGTAAAPIWNENSVTVSNIGAAAGTCASATLSAGVERRTLTLSAAPQSGAVTVAVGNVVYLYDQITYRTGTSAGVPGLWIQRRIGDGSGAANQPMAGPVRDGGNGLKFSYFGDGSASALATPILSAADRESVTRVMVIVETISRNTEAQHQESKTDTLMISLRNRGA